MTRIYFVGFFIGKEDKMSVANLVSDQDVYFLEASNKVKYHGNVTHLPQRLSALKGRYIVQHMFKRVLVNQSVRKYYKKDLLAYYSNLSDSTKSIRNERSQIRLPVSIALYCWDLWRRHYRRNRTKFSAGYSIVRTINAFVTHFRLGRSLSFHKTRRIRSFLLKFGFVAGYNYYNSVFAQINPSHGDVFLNWGLHYSGSLMLQSLIEGTGAESRTLEYGEVAGTVSINKTGIFGDSDCAQNWQEFSQQQIDAQSLTTARAALFEIDVRDAASRGGDSSMFQIYRNMFDLNPNKRRVVYVNGCELIASGLFESPEFYSKEFRNPNEWLLNRVCQSFSEEGAMILYKDHPMTLRASKNKGVMRSKFPSVVFLNELNMKSILEVSDVVVSFPSKVVLTALTKKVKTIVVGRFTIPQEDLGMGLFDEGALADISRLSDGCDHDEQSIVEFVARMLDFWLVKYDRYIFPHFDVQCERDKLVSLIFGQS